MGYRLRPALSPYLLELIDLLASHDVRARGEQRGGRRKACGADRDDDADRELRLRVELLVALAVYLSCERFVVDILCFDCLIVLFAIEVQHL